MTKKEDKKPAPPKVKIVEKIVEKVVEKIVEKRVEVPVDRIVERIVEVKVGLDLSRNEMKGLLSHLPTWSDREAVQSAKEKLLAALKQ